MKLDDIRQGKNGDCFILSSIISLLHVFGQDFINKIVVKIDENNYEFNYYFIECNDIKPDKFFFTYPDKEIIISPKSEDWVKKIENGYINKFYNNDVNKVINDGGAAIDVMTRLSGLNSKIIINRILDNKEQLYYEICKERINHIEWSYDFVKYLNILSAYSVTLFIEKIWKLLKSNQEIFSEVYYSIKFPCVIGTNGHFNKIEIPGVSNEHAYAVLGFKQDKFNNKFLYVFNPHHNVNARITHYNEKTDTFMSEIKKSRYGIWSFNEIILFVSDFTYCK